jgi:hypothetical protein
MEEIKTKAPDFVNTNDGANGEVMAIIYEFVNQVDWYNNRRSMHETESAETLQILHDLMSAREERLTDAILKMCYKRCCSSMYNCKSDGSISAMFLRNKARWDENEVRLMVEDFKDQLTKIWRQSNINIAAPADQVDETIDLINEILESNRNMAIALMVYRVSGLIRCD